MNKDWRDDYLDTLAAAMVDFGYRNPKTHLTVRYELVTPPKPEEVYAVRPGDDLGMRIQSKGYSPANEMHRGAHATARELHRVYGDMAACMLLWHKAVVFWMRQKTTQPDYGDPAWAECCWLMLHLEDGEPSGPSLWQPGDNPFAVDMRRIPVPRASVHWLACMTATIAVINSNAFEILTICG